MSLLTGTAHAVYEIKNPLGSTTDLGQLLTRIASSLMDLAIPVAVAMYLYAGFLWLTAGAKPSNIAKAKEVFKYTTIGLVVIFIGAGFVSLIRSIIALGN